MALIAIGFIAFPPWQLDTLVLSERRNGNITISEQALVRINRITGSTDRLQGEEWLRFKRKEGGDTPLPPQAAGFVTGRAGFNERGFFEVSIYNGSNYQITAIIVRVKAKAAKEEDGYERGFYAHTDIGPLSEGIAQISVTKPVGYESHEWSISSLYGYKVLQ